MRSALRSLERYLVCQVAQIALRPIAKDYVERWKLAREQRQAFPDLNEIIEAAAAVRVPTLSDGPLIDYIYQCADDNRIPNPDRIVKAVVHSYPEDNLMSYGKTCRCPARAPLVTDFRRDEVQA